MAFYIKRNYVDNGPGIEMVNIHYTWTPLNQAPDWEAHRETRSMPRGGTLMRGFGGTTLDETGESVQTQGQVIELPDDGVRRKVIRLPSDVWDPGQEKHVEEYVFHHYYEIFRDGKREESPLYTEEIVAQEVEFADNDGTLGGMCIYWSIYDWDAPQYQPTEVPEFIEKYGEGQPLSVVQVLRLGGHGSLLGETGRNAEDAVPAAPLCGQDPGSTGRPGGAELACGRDVDAQQGRALGRLLGQ